MKKALFSLLAAVIAAAVPAHAATFVKDVMLIGGNQSETTALKNSLTADGWTVINSDLNAGAGGDYVYLLYKPEADTGGDKMNTYFGSVVVEEEVTVDLTAAVPTVTNVRVAQRFDDSDDLEDRYLLWKRTRFRPRRPFRRPPSPGRRASRTSPWYNPDCAA